MQGGNALRKFVHKHVVRPKSSCWYYWYIEEIKKLFGGFVESCCTLYLLTPNCFPLVGKVSLAISQNSLKAQMHQANLWL